MTKIKVKVAGDSRQFMGGQVSNESVESVIARNKRDSQTSIFPKMNHMVQKRTKSIFGKMTDIIIEDIKSIFGKDKKSIEKEMALKRFEEMVKK
jgi:hypothetical protein